MSPYTCSNRIKVNVANRTLFIADNLDIMRGMDSETVDLIYLDPPFNTNKNYEAPIGSAAEGAAFKDIWTDADVKDAWHGELASEHEQLYQVIKASEITHNTSMKIYLTAMAVRLFEMHRVLKSIGSIYLHCDPTASHYLKVIMDNLFGQENFRNEIVWTYTGGTDRKKGFQKKHDLILFYSKSSNFTFNPVYVPFAESTIKRFNKTDKQGRRYKVNRLADGRVTRTYMKTKGKLAPDYWHFNILVRSHSEATGYPTQKPLAILDRIIKASSNEGDIVLDPFCGCATACVAAERLNRHWIGIDISPSAEDLTKLRLSDEVDKAFNLFNPLTDVIIEKNPPERTDNAEEIAMQQQLSTYQVHKPELFGRQQGRCNACEYEFHYRNLSVDHISPQSKGIDNRIENLQLLCPSCSSIKGTGTHAELIQKLRDRKIIRTT